MTAELRPVPSYFHDGLDGDRPMPDLSYLDQCPRRRDFAEALARQIVDDAMPERPLNCQTDPAYQRARGNALALIHGALHVAGNVHDNYPGQDINSMVVFNRWVDAKFGLRQLQMMRAAQMGVGEYSTENC